MELLVFAGTTEGRECIEALLEQGESRLTACVATEYGAEILPRHPNLHVQIGRMDQTAMQQFLQEHSFSYVIDATHPYAAEATRNIRAACAATHTPCLRLVRESQDLPSHIPVADVPQAAAFLNTVEGNVLLTTGSKELAAFTTVQDYQERLFARVLPAPSVLEQCQKMGFSGRHLIAMQGPFSEELNLAMLRQVEAKWLVTKESGSPGGFVEKCRAAQRAGARVILIGRPDQTETGYTQTQLLEILFPVQSQPKATEKYFPLFVSLHGKHVTVFGGGTIAKRRVQALLEFGCRITVIAPESCVPGHPHLTWLARAYQTGDCAGSSLVLAATDSRETNHAIFQECIQKKIPVNVADCKEECDFYFPALLHRGGMVIGVTASGTNHMEARNTIERLRDVQDIIFQTGKGESL